MDLITLNCGQMMRTTLDLALPLQASMPHERSGHLPQTDLTRYRPAYTIDRVESGFKPRTSSPKAETLSPGHCSPCKSRSSS
ncbi:hypothetical protein AVEN_41487-1 [Araneus ventricosus]|nr:hypothetical protein AVEN_34116-1 [Araneus ventricosus]GBN42821.1 hypothetical protein AVEN_41487-1 [Araneus ventricosus]